MQGKLSGKHLVSFSSRPSAGLLVEGASAAGASTFRCAFRPVVFLRAKSERAFLLMVVAAASKLRLGTSTVPAFVGTAVVPGVLSASATLALLLLRFEKKPMALARSR